MRVLLVDDHPVVREGLCSLLRHMPDIEVVGEAGDGPEAIRLVEDTSPDIVLLDVVVAGLSGVEITRKIKRNHPNTAVVVLTAQAEDRHILSLLKAGAMAYLLKSSTGRQVIEALRAVWAGEMVLHPYVLAKVLARAAGSPTAMGAIFERGLTLREMEVLKLAATGKSNKEIAVDLSVCVTTVKSHLVSVFSKMGVASRTEAILQALRKGWIDLENADGEAPPAASGQVTIYV